MISSRILGFGLFLVLFSCNSPNEPTLEKSRAELVVDSAIAFHGGELYEKGSFGFGFRGREFRIARNNGDFEYVNTYRDSAGEHVRRLSNQGYSEELNGEMVPVLPKDSAARSASVNSVVYFALLPGMLNTPAAQKEYLGKEDLKGQSYHKIKVTFTEEGGGEDYDDVFLYWFAEDDYAMDYLAYSYLEDEGGTRFRKAYNRRRVNGLIFQDYVNYKGPNPDSLEYISNLFKRGVLDTLSLIELDQLRVEPFDE